MGHSVYNEDKTPVKNLEYGLKFKIINKIQRRIKKQYDAPSIKTQPKTITESIQEAQKLG